MQLTRNKLLVTHKAVFIDGSLAGAQFPSSVHSKKKVNT